MHDVIQSTIDGIVDMVAQLQVNLSPGTWGALEWVLAILGVTLIFRICMAGIKTIVKVAFTVAVIIGLGVYFGYIRI